MDVNRIIQLDLKRLLKVGSRPMAKLSPIVKTIQAEQKRQKMSTQDLAVRAGISFQALYGIYTGSIPGLDTTERLLRALQLKILVTVEQ
jgi:predicted transcriptional regulator